MPITPNTTDFAQLGVGSDHIEILRRDGITAAFPIQSAVIPDALAGRDILGRSPTGSGKTLAFGLPLLSGLAKAERGAPRALVLAPTRELAEQIAAELRPLAAARRLSVAPVYGGVSYGPQRRQLRSGADVVVACPGRLEDLVAQSALTLGSVNRLVIDEADRMADMGFLPVVRRLVALTAPKRQTLLFSATLAGAVNQLSAEIQSNPVHHLLDSPPIDTINVRHVFWQVQQSRRTHHTADVIDRIGATVVFCRTRRSADRVCAQLGDLGISAAPIHGGRSQSQRTNALRSFATGKVTTLVATDVAARGIHVDGVSGVVHFDPPEDVDTYIHRSGRTARAGARGVVVSLVDARDVTLTKKMQRQIGLAPRVDEPDTNSLTGPSESEPTKPRRALRTDLKPRRKSTMPKGTVKFFNTEKGYGFIAQERGEDLFVHYTNIAGDGHKSLAPGQTVEFEIGQGRKGPEAVNVAVSNDA